MPKKVKTYEIDVNKIKTFEDFKIILKNMGLVYQPLNDEEYNEMKPYLKNTN